MGNLTGFFALGVRGRLVFGRAYFQNFMIRPLNGNNNYLNTPCYKPFIFISKLSSHERWLTNNHNILCSDCKAGSAGRFLPIWCTIISCIGSWCVCSCCLAFPPCPCRTYSICWMGEKRPLCSCFKTELSSPQVNPKKCLIQRIFSQ